MHRPLGSRVVFDDEGNTLAPLAKLAGTTGGPDSVKLDKDKVSQRYAELREEMKVVDKVDKTVDNQRRKEKRVKQKMKLKRGRDDEEDDEDGDHAVSEDGEREARTNKKSKIYFDGESDDDRTKSAEDTGVRADVVTLAEQEELAIKLLSSMHS